MTHSSAQNPPTRLAEHTCRNSCRDPPEDPTLLGLISRRLRSNAVPEPVAHGVPCSLSTSAFPRLFCLQCWHGLPFPRPSSLRLYVLWGEATPAPHTQLYPWATPISFLCFMFFHKDLVFPPVECMPHADRGFCLCSAGSDAQ